MLKSAELNKVFPLRKMVPGVLFQGRSNPDSVFQLINHNGNGKSFRR